jgi:hypothetical protein
VIDRSSVEYALATLARSVVGVSLRFFLSEGNPAMKKSLLPTSLSSVLVLAVLFLVPAGAYAQPRQPGGKSSSKGPASGNETYMVIKIGDEIKVIASSQYKEEETKVKKDNEDRMAEWQDLKKNDPQAPRPQKIVIKKLKTGYRFQKIAQDYADKLKEEQEAKDGGPTPDANPMPPRPRRGR